MTTVRRLRLACRFVAGALLVVASMTSSAYALDTSSFRSLDAWVDDFEQAIPGAGSEAFIAPSAIEQDAFRGCFELALDGSVDAAGACLDGVGFDLEWLVDDGYRVRYLVARERGPSSLGLGAFVVDRSWGRDVSVVVNHPMFDSVTPAVGRAFLQELSARVLLIAGTHRCANATLSTCDGSSTTCGDNSYHISDTAHYLPTLMEVAHEVLATLPIPMKTFNVHGQASDIRDIVLSDGTRDPAPSTACVNRVRDAAMTRGLDVGSCNWPPDSGLSLCGTTNVLGRLLNDSPAPCDTSAAAATERFVHIELKRSIRDDPALLIEAVGEALPLDRIVLRAVRSGADVVVRFPSSVLPLTVTRDVDPQFATSPTTSPTNGPVHVDVSPPAGLHFYAIE